MEMNNRGNQSIIKFFNMYKEAIIILNKDFMIEDANKKAKDLFPVLKGLSIGNVYWDMIPDLMDILIIEECKCLKGENYKTLKTLYKTNNRWFEIDIYALDNSNYIVTFKDVTEFERRLTVKEKEYLELLDSSTIGFYIRDYENEELHISRMWKNRLGLEGFTSKDLYFKFYDLTQPEDFGQFQAIVKEAISKRKHKFKVEYKIKTCGNNYIWILSQIKMTYKEDGSPKKIYGTNIDITDRKLAEIGLIESKKDANKLVAELRKVDKLKNNFISILAHELRNPLATMTMGVSLLDELTPGSEADMKYRKIIKRQTRQLIKLVDDLLDTSKVITNKMDLTRKYIEVNELARELIEEYKDLFNKEEIQLEVECYTEPTYIYADPIRIKQAIGNLLSNALKFTERKGMVKIKVHKDEETDYVLIKVVDTGIGIEPELLSELLEPFVQIDNSLTKDTTGLGLGLSIVQGIINLHKGSIEIKSEGLGKGTKFILKLPINVEDN